MKSESEKKLASKNLTLPNKTVEFMTTPLPSWWSTFTLVLVSALTVWSAFNPAVGPDIPFISEQLGQLFMSGAGILGILKALWDAFQRWTKTGTESLSQIARKQG